jgi:hypothetical protein
MQRDRWIHRTIQRVVRRRAPRSRSSERLRQAMRAWVQHSATPPRARFFGLRRRGARPVESCVVSAKATPTPHAERGASSRVRAMVLAAHVGTIANWSSIVSIATPLSPSRSRDAAAFCLRAPPRDRDHMRARGAARPRAAWASRPSEFARRRKRGNPTPRGRGGGPRARTRGDGSAARPLARRRARPRATAGRGRWEQRRMGSCTTPMLACRPWPATPSPS